MPRDGERSRKRILQAATAEFAAYGIAGARVDRIATSAGVNKAQMYGWFGSKGQLFDAVFEQQLDRIVDVVPFDPDDLPGYAVALYDSYLADPEIIRLASWHRLERAPTGDLLAGFPGRTDHKLTAIAAAQRDGRITGSMSPDEVYSLIMALAGTWSPISASYTASSADPEAEHERRRAALRDAVGRALVPTA